MSLQDWSPFGPPVVPKPAKPVPKAPAPLAGSAPIALVRPDPPARPPTHAGPSVGLEEPLAAQIGAFLRAQQTYTPATLARAAGLTPNTLARCFAGVGMKVSTLEAIVRALDWRLEVRDEGGALIATVPPDGAA